MASLKKLKNKTLIAIEGEPVVAKHRPYLGCSKLGHSCARYLWYSFRWCYQSEHTGRQLRLFGRGHREEPSIIAELEKIGVHCYNDQEEIVMSFGHAKGHIDSRCIGVPEAPNTEHLAEFKTMNLKGFKTLKKDGVQKSKPIYYGQMQIYMRKLGLTRALFITVCKDNDEWYVERVKLDKGFADDMERKADSVILAEEPPEKEFPSTWYECKWCDAKGICHGTAPVQENCRTCVACNLLPEGKWECSRHVLALATDQQRLKCGKYLKLSFLK